MLYFSGIKASFSLPDSEGGCNIMASNIVGKLELPPFSKEVKQATREKSTTFNLMFCHEKEGAICSQ